MLLNLLTKKQIDNFDYISAQWKISASHTDLTVTWYEMFVWHQDISCRSYKDKTGKMRTFPEAIRPLVPLVLLFAISTIWIVHSPNNILEEDPRIIYFAIGTIFSNICVRYNGSSIYLLWSTLNVTIITIIIIAVSTNRVTNE